MGVLTRGRLKGRTPLLVLQVPVLPLVISRSRAGPRHLQFDLQSVNVVYIQHWLGGVSLQTLQRRRWGKILAEGYL